ncbi:TSL-kinase interacting protein 1 [Malania oleifera]|uniref:TSL-kinase interacting protein 1 n=1 Tax=Malania oleifera TaxID=397392 RepID=UPI0025AE73C2|nr:TSL-kinase interacting protein 1 [Malania oleifera]
MKVARPRKRKKVEVHTRLNSCTDCNGVQKFTKRTNVLDPKVIGHNSNILVEKDNNSRTSKTAQKLSQQFPDKAAHLMETTKNVTMLKLGSGNTLDPSVKIKMQLFPIDENTRIGLEKDGHNPYLELTLRPRKKISSVLKHLNSKWGSSSIALGALTLFPYNTSPECPVSCRTWTLDDNVSSAGDVYAAIGNPAIFRLRYGWFSKFEPKASHIPLPSTSFEAFSHHKGTQEGCGADTETKSDRKKQEEVAGEDIRPLDKSTATNVLMAGQMSSDMQLGLKDDEGRTENGLSLTSALWADSLTNISIGGLLSEASLQGKFNNCDPKLTQSNSSLQTAQIISDSFDAFVAGQKNTHSQGLRPSSRAQNLSILDAEETCHAFPFQKFSSSGKDALPSCQTDAGDQDTSSKSFKFPNVAEVNGQSRLVQDNSCQESKPDMLSCSRLYNDESSLGLTGINWNDSLGPFDLGLSSRRIINGDSVSFSKFVG